MNIIVVGKSGSGKNEVMNYFKDIGYNEIVSYTTRKQREGESDDTYHFSTRKEFDAHRIQGKIFEYTQFGNNYYWTLVDDFSKDPWAIIVDPVGVIALKKEFPYAGILLVTAPDKDREGRIDAARYMRDTGKFTDFPCDYVIENSGSLEDLKKKTLDAKTYFETHI